MARRNTVAVLIAVALVAIGAGGFALADSGAGSQDQCTLPLSERVGGWVCPGATPDP